MSAESLFATAHNIIFEKKNSEPIIAVNRITPNTSHISVLAAGWMSWIFRVSFQTIVRHVRVKTVGWKSVFWANASNLYNAKWGDFANAWLLVRPKGRFLNVPFKLTTLVLPLGWLKFWLEVIISSEVPTFAIATRHLGQYNLGGEVEQKQFDISQYQYLPNTRMRYLSRSAPNSSGRIFYFVLGSRERKLEVNSKKTFFSNIRNITLS